MVDAPERIWADGDGVWHSHDYSEVRPCTIYLRADIAASQLAEERAAAERQWAGWVKEEALRKAAEAERDRLAADNARLREALAKIAGTRMKSRPDADIARAALAGKE